MSSLPSPSPDVHPLDVLARASPAASWSQSSAAVAALPTGASSVEITSREAENRRAQAAAASTLVDDAAVATPAALSGAGSHSSHSEAVDTRAGVVAGSEGDGYVTPPTRAAAALDELVAPDAQQPPDASSTAAAACSASSPAALFSPLLLAAAAPLGGILSPTGHKRKRLDAKPRGRSGASSTATAKRKGSRDFLRKGQWTATEEKFTRALLDAFDAGYLPIFTGVRLRGYLAVQLQCDPMRISKKLCGGTVDGQKVPKNYGQLKYKMRKPQLWDELEAARVVADLERLARALWSESGLARPGFLSLSSTRSSADLLAAASSLDAAPFAGAADWLSDAESDASSSSSSASPASSVGTTLPIIYLNLAKRHKKSAAAALAAVATRRSDDARVDGDSLQAAYDLLNLLQAPPDDESAA